MFQAEHPVSEQGVLSPSYFNYPDSGISDGPAYTANLNAAASSKQTGKQTSRAARGGRAGKAAKAGKVSKIGKAGNAEAFTASPVLSGGRARSSASTSMHFLQREAREAFVSDLDGDVMEIDGEESRTTLRKLRPPAAVAAASSNQVDVDAGAAEDVGQVAHGHDDGSYERHAAKYDDGSYEAHAAKYDDGSYEPHAAKYDDGSYERHAANYDDGSYEPHAAKYDDGSYEPHAARFDDGSYEKHARLYNDGSYLHGGGQAQTHQPVQEAVDEDGDDLA